MGSVEDRVKNEDGSLVMSLRSIRLTKQKGFRPYYVYLLKGSPWRRPGLHSIGYSPRVS